MLASVASHACTNNWNFKSLECRVHHRPLLTGSNIDNESNSINTGIQI